MEGLNQKPIKELRAMRDQLGLKAQQHESKESIINQLVMVSEHLVHEQTKPRMPVQPQEVIAPPTKLTQEQVLKGIDSYLKRGVKIRFEGDTWHVKNGDAEDSGHMTMPLPLVIQKVGFVANARLPATVKIDGENMLAV